MDKVPFLSTVYRSVKQIVETFGKENRAVFKSVALIEYPRKDCWVLGFVTGDASSDTKGLVGKKPTNIFVPTTPNPTSGFLLLVQEKRSLLGHVGWRWNENVDFWWCSCASKSKSGE